MCDKKKLIVTCSEVIVGWDSVYDSSMGQFYPNEIMGTTIEFVEVPEREVDDVIHESEDVVWQIVADFVVEREDLGMVAYKHDNVVYVVKGETLVEIKNKRTRRLV